MAHLYAKKMATFVVSNSFDTTKVTIYLILAVSATFTILLIRKT